MEVLRHGLVCEEGLRRYRQQAASTTSDGDVLLLVVAVMALVFKMREERSNGEPTQEQAEEHGLPIYLSRLFYMPVVCEAKAVVSFVAFVLLYSLQVCPVSVQAARESGSTSEQTCRRHIAFTTPVPTNHEIPPIINSTATIAVIE